MYAVVELKNKQILVEQDLRVEVDRLDNNPGDELVIEKVLFLSKDGASTIGQPTVANAKVVCNVERHYRGKKKISFKFKRRKDTKVKKGFRAELTELKVKEIIS